MATKKTIELQEFSLEDLQNELVGAKSQYEKMKFDHFVQGLENPLELRNVRRDVARLQTEIRKREIQNMDAEQLANRTKIRRRRSAKRR